MRDHDAKSSKEYVGKPFIGETLNISVIPIFLQKCPQFDVADSVSRVRREE